MLGPYVKGQIKVVGYHVKNLHIKILHEVYNKWYESRYLIYKDGSINKKSQNEQTITYHIY